MFILLTTKNDTNGNPRRLYVLINETGAYMQAWDHGYAGIHAVPEKYRAQAARAVYVETTPTFYRKIKKEFVK